MALATCQNAENILLTIWSSNQLLYHVLEYTAPPSIAYLENVVLTDLSRVAYRDPLQTPSQLAVLRSIRADDARIQVSYALDSVRWIQMMLSLTGMPSCRVYWVLRTLCQPDL